MLLSQQRITPRISDFFKKGRYISIKQYVSKPYIYWVGSGREALRQILSHCRVKNSKTKLKVGIPAYTCQVVQDAIERAGCIPGCPGRRDHRLCPLGHGQVHPPLHPSRSCGFLHGGGRHYPPGGDLPARGGEHLHVRAHRIPSLFLFRELYARPLRT